MGVLIALKPLTYGTRRLRAGDEFEATRNDCVIYPMVGLAAHKPEPDPAEAIRAAILTDLQAQYHALAHKPADKRWGIRRLRREIEGLFK